MKTCSLIAKSIAVSVLLWASLASASVQVGSAALEQPIGDYSTELILDAGSFQQCILVNNVEDLSRFKLFWMKVTMDTANGSPQAAGSDFIASYWPTVYAPDSISFPTGAADVFTGTTASWSWYFTATISPQPCCELVKFEDKWWDTWGSHITQIEIRTACVPEPATWMGGAAMALVFSAGAWRKLRLFP